MPFHMFAQSDQSLLCLGAEILHINGYPICGREDSGQTARMRRLGLMFSWSTQEVTTCHFYLVKQVVYVCTKTYVVGTH